MKSTTCNGAWHHFSSSTMLSEGARAPVPAARAAPALCLSVHAFYWLRRISPLMVLRLLERGGGGTVAATRCEREAYRSTRSPAPLAAAEDIQSCPRGGKRGQRTNSAGAVTKRRRLEGC